MTTQMTTRIRRRFGRVHWSQALCLCLVAGAGACEVSSKNTSSPLAPNDEGASNADAAVGSDASTADADVDAGPQQDADAAPLPDCDAAPPLLASSYPASCSVDTDCAAVAPGGAVCNPCAFICPTVAIDRDASIQYQTAMLQAATTYAVARTQLECASGCPLLRGPCCVAGQCQMGSACPAPSVDAGQP